MRWEHSLFLAEGLRLVNELASYPEQVEFLYALPESLPTIHQTLQERSVYLLEENDADLFATENPQGVGAVVRMREPVSVEHCAAMQKPVLFLDALADPGNAGTILRAADWFGVGAVLFGQGSVDPYNPKVVRATMGATFRLPFREGVSPKDVLSLNRPIYALDAAGETLSGNGTLLGERVLPKNGLYVVGNEAHGVSDVWHEHGTLIGIPGSGKGESLNAAMAATVLCWELSRLDQ